MTSSLLAIDEKTLQPQPEISELSANAPQNEALSKVAGNTERLEAPEDKAVSILSGKETKVNFGFLPIPKNCRVSQTKPFKFNLAINLLFGFASTFTVFQNVPKLTPGCKPLLQSTYLNTSFIVVWGTLRQDLECSVLDTGGLCSGIVTHLAVRRSSQTTTFGVTALRLWSTGVDWFSDDV
jgi:hypothetical protein